MGDNVGKDELRDVRDEIIKEMRSGFAGVHARQDVTNGRIGQAEVVLGRHDVRLVNVERELFPRRARPASDPASEPRERRISDRDVKIVLATVGATATVGTALFKALPIILRAVLP